MKKKTLIQFLPTAILTYTLIQTAGFAASPPTPNITTLNNQVQYLIQQNYSHQIEQLQEQVAQFRGTTDTLSHQINQQNQVIEQLKKQITSLSNAVHTKKETTSSTSTSTNHKKMPLKDKTNEHLYIKGYNALQAKQYKTAKKYLYAYTHDKIMGKHEYEGYFWLGETELMLHDIPAAKQAYLQAIKSLRNPQTPTALYRLGLIYISENQSKTAQSYFKRLIKQYPNAKITASAKSQLNNLIQDQRFSKS